MKLHLTFLNIKGHSACLCTIPWKYFCAIRPTWFPDTRKLHLKVFNFKIVPGWSDYLFEAPLLQPSHIRASQPQGKPQSLSPLYYLNPRLLLVDHFIFFKVIIVTFVLFAYLTVFLFYESRCLVLHMTVTVLVYHILCIVSYTGHTATILFISCYKFKQLKPLLVMQGYSDTSSLICGTLLFGQAGV